ncbi:hypothetical protein B0H14DRAFT_3614094, partial [Mycena olivaceomarginata]
GVQSGLQHSSFARSAPPTALALGGHCACLPPPAASHPPAPLPAPPPALPHLRPGAGARVCTVRNLPVSPPHWPSLRSFASLPPGCEHARARAFPTRVRSNAHDRQATPSPRAQRSPGGLGGPVISLYRTIHFCGDPLYRLRPSRHPSRHPSRPVGLCRKNGR